MSIDLTSDAARASRLDNLTFSSYVSEANPSNRRARPPVGCRLSIPTKTLPFRLHLSDAVSLDLPSDAGASSLARHPYLSNLLLNEAHPSDTAILKPVGRRREPPGQTTFLFHPAAGKAYPTTLPVDCEAFRPPKLCLSV